MGSLTFTNVLIEKSYAQLTKLQGRKNVFFNKNVKKLRKLNRIHILLEKYKPVFCALACSCADPENSVRGSWQLSTYSQMTERTSLDNVIYLRESR